MEPQQVYFMSRRQLVILNWPELFVPMQILIPPLTKMMSHWFQLLVILLTIVDRSSQLTKLIVLPLRQMGPSEQVLLLLQLMQK